MIETWMIVLWMIDSYPSCVWKRPIIMFVWHHFMDRTIKNTVDC